MRFSRTLERPGRDVEGRELRPVGRRERLAEREHGLRGRKLRQNGLAKLMQRRSLEKKASTPGRKCTREEGRPQRRHPRPRPLNP